MKHTVEQTMKCAVLVCAFGISAAIYANPPVHIIDSHAGQEAGVTVKDVEALMKHQQQEWDIMIAEQNKSLQSAISEKERLQLMKRHKQQRKEMEEKHRKELAALKKTKS